jgi:5-methylcytosine-specific restriction endonuclease McrA
MRYLKLHEWLTSCDECLDLFPNKERKELPKLVKYRASWRSNCYCATCYDKIVDRYTETCLICKEKKLEYKDGCCIECYKKESLNIQHVQIHLSRARKAGTEATLTFNQWKRAVEYFNYRCAYCVEYPYEVLEHYIPLTLGGGTTADNCVPACSSCNNRKGNVMPEIFARYFRQENLIRVRDFLELQREDNSDREESSTCSA